jgi:hypothetical protein
MTMTFKTVAFALALSATAMVGCEKTTAEKAKDVARDAKDVAKDAARDANAAAKDAARDAESAAKDAGRKMDEAGRDGKDIVKDKLRDAKDALKDAGTAVADKAKEAAAAAKKAFQGPVDTTLEKADKEIARLEEGQKTASGEAKKALDEKVGKAKDLRSKLRSKLKDLGEAGADKWEGMKTDIEQLSKDLSKTLGL